MLIAKMCSDYSAVSQPWKLWLEKEKEDAEGSGSEDMKCVPQNPWLSWKPTPQDPSVKPWLSWNAFMDNGDVDGDENKRVITHVMSACSRFDHLFR